MSNFLGIDIKTLDDGGFHFFQTGYIRKVLKATGIEHCNWFPITTKVEAPCEIDTNISEAKNIGPTNMILL